MRGQGVSAKTGLLVVGWALLAQGCAPKGPPAGPPKGPTLRLESLLPAAGTMVVPSTVLEAELSYTVPEAEFDRFRVMPVFETKNPRTTVNADNAGTFFSSAAGTCRVRVFLEAAWRAPQIKRPFKVWFHLTRSGDGSRSDVVASLGPFTFPTE
jgi:hypothetical protein